MNDVLEDGMMSGRLQGKRTHNNNTHRELGAGKKVYKTVEGVPRGLAEKPHTTIVRTGSRTCNISNVCEVVPYGILSSLYRHLEVIVAATNQELSVKREDCLVFSASLKCVCGMLKRGIVTEMVCPQEVRAHS